jgi:hypothetical protein
MCTHEGFVPRRGASDNLHKLIQLIWNTERKLKPVTTILLMPRSPLMQLNGTAGIMC